VRNNGFDLPAHVETLATTLSRRGYRTGAFVSSFVLDRRYGLARGFATYDDSMPPSDRLAKWGGEPERRGDATAEARPSPRESPSATDDGKSQFDALRGAHAILQTGRQRTRTIPPRQRVCVGTQTFACSPHL